MSPMLWVLLAAGAGGIVSLAMIFCGVMGLRATRGGAMQGRGLAWFGIVVGCGGIAAIAMCS